MGDVRVNEEVSELDALLKSWESDWSNFKRLGACTIDPPA